MSAFVMAWIVGEAIIIYRTVKQYKAPPGPGQLVWTSGLFVMLALLAESEKARPLATTLAWGFDIAAFLNIFQTGVAPMATTWPPPKLPDTVILPEQLGQNGGGHAEGQLIPRGEWPGGSAT